MREYSPALEWYFRGQQVTAEYIMKAIGRWEMCPTNVPVRDGQGGVASKLGLQSHQETCCAWLARSGEIHI